MIRKTHTSVFRGGRGIKKVKFSLTLNLTATLISILVILNNKKISRWKQFIVP